MPAVRRPAFGAATRCFGDVRQRCLCVGRHCRPVWGVSPVVGPEPTSGGASDDRRQWVVVASKDWSVASGSAGVCRSQVRPTSVDWKKAIGPSLLSVVPVERHPATHRL